MEVVGNFTQAKRNFSKQIVDEDSIKQLGECLGIEENEVKSAIYNVHPIDGRYTVHCTLYMVFSQFFVCAVSRQKTMVLFCALGCLTLILLLIINPKGNP